MADAEVDLTKIPEDVEEDGKCNNAVFSFPLPFRGIGFVRL
jgi:hypothetical protein